MQRYAPEIEKRVRWYQGYRSPSWRVDETYVRVGGTWKYLFRAVDKTGCLIDFMLSDRRNTRTAHRFLAKTLKTMRNWPPVSIAMDRLGSYRKAIRRLQRDGHLSDDVVHRTSKYLNNIIEADHGALKQLIRPARGFQTMKTAYATIKGFEIMRMIRRGRFANKLFGFDAVMDGMEPPEERNLVHGAMGRIFHHVRRHKHDDKLDHAGERPEPFL